MKYSGQWGWPDGRGAFLKGRRGNGTRAWRDGSARRWRGRLVVWRPEHFLLRLDIVSELDDEAFRRSVARWHRRHWWMGLPSTRLRGAEEDVRRLWACPACLRVTPAGFGEDGPPAFLGHFARCRRSNWRPCRGTSRLAGFPVERTLDTARTMVRCVECRRAVTEERLHVWTAIGERLRHRKRWPDGRRCPRVSPAKVAELVARRLHRRSCQRRSGAAP